MNRTEQQLLEDRADLGAARVETRGQTKGSVPDGFDHRLEGGMTDD